MLMPVFSEQVIEYAERLAEASQQIARDLRLSNAEVCEGVTLFAGTIARTKAEWGQVEKLSLGMQVGIGLVAEAGARRPDHIDPYPHRHASRVVYLRSRTQNRAVPGE